MTMWFPEITSQSCLIDRIWYKSTCNFPRTSLFIIHFALASISLNVSCYSLHKMLLFWCRCRCGCFCGCFCCCCWCLCWCFQHPNIFDKQSVSEKINIVCWWQLVRQNSFVSRMCSMKHCSFSLIAIFQKHRFDKESQRKTQVRLSIILD